MAHPITLGLRIGIVACGGTAFVLSLLWKRFSGKVLQARDVRRFKRLATVFRISLLGGALFVLFIAQWHMLGYAPGQANEVWVFATCAVGYGVALMGFVLAYGTCQEALQYVSKRSVKVISADSYHWMLVEQLGRKDPEILRAFLAESLEKCPDDAGLLSELGFVSDAVCGDAQLADAFFSRARACAVGPADEARYLRNRAACLAHRADAEGAAACMSRFAEAMKSMYAVVAGKNAGSRAGLPAHDKSREGDT